MAQKKNSQQGMSAFYWVLGLIAIVGIAVIGWVVFKGRTSNMAMEPVPVPGADNPQALVATAKGMTVGPDGAPVKMLVFSDYQCPYCGQFASQIEPALINEFANSGKMQLVFYDFPLGGGHKYSFLAARAARCAGDQNKFWQYHDVLFGRQIEWAEDESLPLKKFLDYGKDVGLDAGQFKSCVESNKYQDIVSANRELGDKLGVNSTPTIFVNGRRVEGNSMEDLMKNLRDTINREAGAAAPAADTAKK